MKSKAIILLLVAACWPYAAARAATFTVTKTADTADGACDADCSLREAIVASNAAAGADTIQLPAGTYVLSIAGAGEDAGAAGDLDVTGNLTIQGAGRDTTIVDAAGLDRVFDVRPGLTPGSGPAVSFAGLAIRGGKTGEAEARGDGGGVRAAGRSASFTDCAIDSNEALGYGGGVYASLSSPTTFARCRITSNLAVQDDEPEQGRGGGVYADGSVSLVDATVAFNGSDRDGGGVYARKSLTAASSAFAVNVAAQGSGGGIYAARAALQLTNVTVTLNLALEGGGVFGGDGTITNCTIADNDTVAGGDGISPGKVSVRNTVVRNDCGKDAPRALVSLGGNLASGSTCNFKHAGDRELTDPKMGLFADNGGPTGTLLPLAGSPLIDGGDGVGCPATDQRGLARGVDGNGDGVGRCDIGAVELAGACTDFDGDGTTSCAGDCDDANALRRAGLAEVCDAFDNDCDGAVNGGLDCDGDGVKVPSDCDDTNAAVHPGAAEICNGIDDDCNEGADEDHDGDGYDVCTDCDDNDRGRSPGLAERPLNGKDDDCDGEVDEFDGRVFTVTKTEDTFDGSCDADCSLREAAFASNAAPRTDRIEIPAGTYVLTLAGAVETPPFYEEGVGPIQFYDSVLVVGAGRDQTVIDAGGANRAIFASTINYGVLALSGLTLQGGAAPAGESDLYGADIAAYAEQGLVALSDCIVKGGAAYIGGGAHLYADTVTVDRCAFEDNAASEDGGGLYVAYDTKRFDIRDSTFSGNSAGADGGGLYVGSGVERVDMFDSSFSGNSSSEGAGAWLGGETLTVEGSRFMENAAEWLGGGLVLDSDVFDATVSASEFADNEARLGGGIAYEGYYGRLSLLDSVLRDNRAADEGGGLYRSGELEVRRTLVQANTADEHGGGIAVGEGRFDIAESAFVGNHAGDGGGLWTFAAYFEGYDPDAQDSIFGAPIVNTTFSGNEATRGGAIHRETFGEFEGPPFREEEIVSLRNVTFAANVAGEGAAVFTDAPMRAASVVLDDGAGACSLAIPIESLGRNVDAGDSCGFADPTDLAGADPKLGPLADNGGPTPTHALLMGSPAIDLGGSCPAVDQRGEPRSDGACDAGAYEMRKATVICGAVPAAASPWAAAVLLAPLAWIALRRRR